MSVQAAQVRGGHDRPEFATQNGRVVLRTLEDDAGPGVGEHGLPDGRRQLAQVVRSIRTIPGVVRVSRSAG